MLGLVKHILLNELEKMMRQWICSNIRQVWDIPLNRLSVLRIGSVPFWTTKSWFLIENFVTQSKNCMSFPLHWTQSYGFVMLKMIRPLPNRCVFWAIANAYGVKPLTRMWELVKKLMVWRGEFDDILSNILLCILRNVLCSGTEYFVTWAMPIWKTTNLKKHTRLFTR